MLKITIDSEEDKQQKAPTEKEKEEIPAPSEREISKTIKLKVNIEIPDLNDDSPFKLRMNARKTLDNKYMVRDHQDMDIVYDSKANKITAYMKGENSGEVYESQSRLYDFLFKKGIVSQETIQGGSVFGALEAKVLEPEDSSFPLEETVLFMIGKFLQEDKEIQSFENGLEREEEIRLLYPDEEHSTELGEVPHEKKKGSMSNATYVRPIQPPYLYL